MAGGERLRRFDDERSRSRSRSRFRSRSRSRCLSRLRSRLRSRSRSRGSLRWPSLWLRSTTASRLDLGVSRRLRLSSCRLRFCGGDAPPGRLGDSALAAFRGILTRSTGVSISHSALSSSIIRLYGLKSGQLLSNVDLHRHVPSFQRERPEGPKLCACAHQSLSSAALKSLPWRSTASFSRFRSFWLFHLVIIVLAFATSLAALCV